MNQTLTDSFMQAVGITSSIDGTVNKYQKYFYEGTRELLLDLAREIIEKQFTEEELTCLVALYTSPIGKKLTTIMPAVIRELGTVISGLVQNSVNLQNTKTPTYLA